jgi:hypothetical protein
VPNAEPPPPPPSAAPPADPPSLERWILPTGRSGWAIAAGYLGLLALVVVPAPIALLVGIVALRDLGRRPHLGGRGRAWFGTVAGALGTIALVALLVLT